MSRTPESPTPVTSRHRRGHRRRRRGAASWSLLAKLVAAVIGVALTGGVAFAASSWIVGLSSGSNGEAASASVTNVSIAAISTPSPSNTLYPGATGDVVAKITNPNSFPVTITAVNLPTSTTYAAGFSDAALTTTQTGCTSSTSLVAWANATSTSGSSHTLTSPLTVAANGILTVTFTNDATMGASSPSVCQATYFSMPSLTGVTATGGAGTATTGPATDAWTS